MSSPFPCVGVSDEWVEFIVPNLPTHHRDEYVLRLAAFRPNYPFVNIRFKTFVPDVASAVWTFPFILTEEIAYIEGDHGFDPCAFDEWEYNVELDMMKKYGLNESHFMAD